MASIELDIGLATPVAAAPRPALGARLAAILAGWRARRAQHRALQDLVAFSPHLLNDLGITQADIAAGLEGRPFEVSRR